MGAFKGGRRRAAVEASARRVEVLNVKPGDVAVYHVDQPLAHVAVERLREDHERVLPGVPAAVLGPGCRMTLMRR